MPVCVVAFPSKAEQTNTIYLLRPLSIQGSLETSTPCTLTKADDRKRRIKNLRTVNNAMLVHGNYSSVVEIGNSPAYDSVTEIT